MLLMRSEKLLPLFFESENDYLQRIRKRRKGFCAKSLINLSLESMMPSLLGQE